MFDIGFPGDWSSLKKLIWLKAAISGGGASAVWKTVTGTLIHITDALASPMRKCEVSLEPIQDLHGQDAPYPAGGGVNKFGGVYNVRFTFLTPIPSGTTITVSTANGSDNTRVNFGNDSDSRFYNGGVNTLNSELNRKYRVLTLAQEAKSVYFDVFDSGDYQIEIGDTPTTYKPFANICPITGWTGCEVYRTGVNVWDEEWEVGDIDNDGQPTTSTTLIRAKNFNACKPDTAYYVKKPSTASLYMKFYDKDKNFIYPTISANGGITTPPNCYYFKFVLGSAYGTTYNHDVSINYPSTDTSYHAYSGTTLSVTFPDSAGTVYGGTLDVVSGVLTVDTVCNTYDGSEDEGWSKRSMGSAASYSMAINSPDIKQLSDDVAYVKSNYLKSIPNSSTWGNYDNFISKTAVYLSAQENKIVCGIETITTLSAWKEYLSENPLQIMYPLATPLTYQLTPQEISTLAGENNVWSNTNSDTTIIYKAQSE